MTSGPVQPQCFCSLKEPTPAMSAAGFARVKVVQRKLAERPGGEIAVIDDDEERKTVERARRFNRITKASD